MSKNRLEAFSDGVLAIVITIMVLELKVPHEADWTALARLWPILLSYVVSFVYIGIYWNNHHHLFQIVKHVDGKVLWANMHLLFWLSVVPFVTGWMGENHFAAIPVAAYGIVLFMAAVAYFILTRALLARHGTESDLSAALGNDIKGKISIVLYLGAIVAALDVPLVAGAVYVGVAILWIVPDRRVEKRLLG